MILPKYLISDTDKWQWKPATGPDVDDIVRLSHIDFGSEVDGIFDIDPILMGKNVATAVITQLYSPHETFFVVARDRESNEICAYCWAVRQRYMEYSFNEMSEIRFIHIKQDLSARDRVTLVAQILNIWHDWCAQCGIEVMASTTLRGQQDGFLHLHREAGFSVNGSCAYRRVIQEQADAPAVEEPSRIILE